MSLWVIILLGMHTLVVQVYALAGHAPVGTCTCVSAIDLMHGLVNMHAAQPSVWHFSALVSMVHSYANRNSSLRKFYFLIVHHLNSLLQGLSSVGRNR